MCHPIIRFSPPALLLAALWSSGANALLIDSFDDDITLIAETATGDLAIGSTPNSANMIGDRNMQVSKPPTAPGIVNAAIAEVAGGLLGMSNGPITTGAVLLSYSFATIDLTEGGTNAGFFLSLPSQIDNDLDLYIFMGGSATTDYSLTFSDGSSGNDFYIPFSAFTDPTVAMSTSQLIFVFSNGPAWDAQIDFIETSAPPENGVSAPASLSLFGLGLVGLGWARRGQA